jgi:SRSO17 transposase
LYKYDKTPLYGRISDYEDDLKLHKVDETEWEAYWNKLVNHYHYLGFNSSFGGRVKYIITLGGRIVGAISFCSAMYRLGPRDTYIGWDEETRATMLPHLVNNNRFLILPGINIKNLASRVLSMSLRQMQWDWEKQYEVVPYMVETFVDRGQYKGTCYKAANWTYLGVTKGYGKIGEDFVYHGRKKDLYVYIIDRQFAKRFKPDITRINNECTEREELNAMLIGQPVWYPNILKELGITDRPAQKITQKFIEHLLRYTPFLGRSENKLHFMSMIQGLLSDLKRKSIEPIAIAFQGIDSVRNLTNFMSRGKWDDAGVLEEYQNEASELLSHDEGMITGDDTGFPKKGHKSVGVTRQYCGSTGKVDNCQSGVMVGYASAKGYGLIDYELYMPGQWFDEDHKSLRKKCDVPSCIRFKTKNEMLLEMIQDTVRPGKFQAKYVGVDCSFGSDSDFLDGLPDSVIYFADVRSSQLVFAYRPVVYTPAYSGKGRRPTREKTDVAPLTVKKIIEGSEEPWERVVLGIGAKGPVIAEDKCLRVVEVRGGLPGKDVWLYARKLDDGTIKYALCNAPADAPKQEIRKPALMRWSIEQCFKECKDYLGMDHYESRSWDAWHRHILLTLIAHLFIIKLRIGFSRKPDTPSPTPYVETPVTLGDYLKAVEQMASHEQISHPDISLMPDKPQQFMTIGLVQKLVNATFPKVGLVVEEVNYLAYKAASAFCSHSEATVKKARQLQLESSG